MKNKNNYILEETILEKNNLNLDLNRLILFFLGKIFYENNFKKKELHILLFFLYYWLNFLLIPILIIPYLKMNHFEIENKKREKRENNKLRKFSLSKKKIN